MKPLQPGQALDAYRIIRPLGEGGMGCVYEAEHVGLRVRRALKVFSAESEHSEFLRRRFVAEGRMLADLQHPRIVRVYDFAVDESSGAPYFAMDLVVSAAGESRTLEDACRDGVEEEQVAVWFRDICEGLAYIHAHDVVHRDISLDNILIDRDGRAVLTDFGIARITGEAYRRKIDVTVTMAALADGKFRLGKGLYMSPELRAGGEATPASDAYAVGVLLFRLLTGSWLTAETRLEDALAGMEYNWADVIGRLCAKSPAERLGSEGMVGVGQYLRRIDIRPPRRRMLGALAVLVVVLLAALAFWLTRGVEPKPSPVPVVPTAPQPIRDVASTSVYHIVDIPVTQTVYTIVTFTNVVEHPAAK